MATDRKKAGKWSELEGETFAPFPFPFEKPQGARVDLATFDDFVEIATGRSHKHGLAWRGMRSASSRLMSSAFRAEKERLKLYQPVTGRENHHQEILCISRLVESRMKHISRLVQNAIGTDPHLRLLFRHEIEDKEIHNNPEGYDELLAVARHFGLAAPLIDVTASAYVALYFAARGAMEESQEWRANKYNRIAVWEIPTNLFRGERTYSFVPHTDRETLASWQHKLDKNSEIKLPPRSMRVTIRNVFPHAFRSDRLIAQQGSFVRITPDLPLDHVLGLMHERAEEFVFEQSSEHLYQYTLPASLAFECLMHVSKMNIRPDTLFPDMVGQVDFINLAASHYDYDGLGDRMEGSLYDVSGDRRNCHV